MGNVRHFIPMVFLKDGRIIPAIFFLSTPMNPEILRGLIQIAKLSPTLERTTT